MAILTAHGVACRFFLNTDEKCNKIIDKISLPDYSTLYCSLIVGQTWQETIFFGGTALGELLLWQMDPNNVDNGATILHRLSAHNGVVFSIRCSLEHGIITTTSDDRSVKIWNLTKTQTVTWKNCSIKPIRSLFGHTGRVFCNKIITASKFLLIFH